MLKELNSKIMQGQNNNISEDLWSQTYPMFAGVLFK